MNNDGKISETICNWTFENKSILFDKILFVRD